MHPLRANTVHELALKHSLRTIGSLCALRFRCMSRRMTDVLVIGSGIAGLSAALGAARNGTSVTVATKATRPEGASTWWAQGGIAVARKDPRLLKRDIETASSGTSDPEAIDVLVQHADRVVRDVLIDTLDVGLSLLTTN